MKAADIPTRIEVSFAASAVDPYIREIPIPSQIGITDGRASFTTGFPPDTFSPESAGGIPPAGSDFNGIISRVSQWNRWQCAGGPVPWNAGYSSTVGGYPLGAIIASATPGQMWLNVVDDNPSNPDAAGADWQNFYVGWTGVVAGAYVRPQITVAADGKITAAANGTYPTRTTLLSGTATYAPPAGTKRLNIRMVGAGGGGGGTGTSGQGNGTAGTATAFGTVQANPGAGGGANVASAPGGVGAGGSSGSGSATNRWAGSSGRLGQAANAAVNVCKGGDGSGTPFSGGGSGTLGAGVAPAVNSGGGGPGAGANAISSSVGSASAGGSGEYVELIINNPGASYSYTVGTHGNGGSAGASGVAGTNGSDGVIVIDEMYD